jgi:tRNA(Ile)-lysidine synthase TilS/MesJ
MGHNKDDCLENIMTNIAQKNKYDNLHGMLPVSIQDDIKFIRPLLETHKDNIVQFANDNNIPYLPNSTPVWSQRGQIRNNIVPVLDKWNNRFIDSLFSLSNTTSSLYKVLESSVSQYVSKGKFNVNQQSYSINIAVNEIINEHIFWKEFFIKTFNIYLSSKSLENLIFSMNRYLSMYKDIQQNEKRKVMVTKTMVFEMFKKTDTMIGIIIYKN